MRAYRLVSLLLLLVLLCGTLAVPVGAEEEAPWIDGVDSTDLLPMERQCALQVDKVEMLFDIPEFPTGLNKSAAFAAYPAKITATYTIQNPMEEAVSTDLLFPFGKQPSYVLWQDSQSGRVPLPTLAEKYRITVNGDAAKVTEHHATDERDTLPGHATNAGAVEHWYAFTLTLQPGETATVVTEAPLYPDVSYHYDPAVYAYTHRFYAKDTWMEPGELTVTVNTGYYRTEGLSGYRKTATGYTQTLRRFADGQLTFSLSTAEMPVEKDEDAPQVYYHSPFPFQLFVPVAIIAGGLLLVFIIEAIIHRSKKE